MIDENFQESSIRSCDGKFLCRLFRIESDDNSIHMSIEVKQHERVIYALPKEYWLGTEELLDWDIDQNILFFTVNGRTKVFIYDVTSMTIVSRDILPTDELLWDDQKKQWEINSYYTMVKGDKRQSGVLRNILALPYAIDKPIRNHIEETKVESGDEKPPEATCHPIEEPYRYALPRDQRRWMIIASFFMLLVLFGLWAVFLDSPTEGKVATILMASIIASISFVIVGRDVWHKAKKPINYNIGCWLLWAGIWFAVMALATIIASFSMILDDLT